MTPVPGADLLDACIHCGLCLDTCPTFLETGNEAESPRGRLHLLRALEEGRLSADSVTVGHLDSCLGCLACEAVCPSGVLYGDIIQSFHAQRTGAPRSRVESFLVRRVLWRGVWLERLRPLLTGAAWAAGILRRLPLPRGADIRLALVRAPEGRPGPGDTPARESETEAPQVHLLRGCVARAMLPATEAATIRLLRAAGYRVRVHEDGTCCGALASHAGETRLARDLVREAARILEGTRGAVLAQASGCGAHLARSQAMGEAGGRVDDLSRLLVNGPRRLRFRPSSGVRVVFQDPCHMRHGLGVGDEPRSLLAMAGYDVCDVAERDVCCGSAGSYNLARPEMGFRLGQRKMKRLRDADADADCIVTANPGCLIQLEAHRGSGDPQVIPLARVLADRLLPDDA